MIRSMQPAVPLAVAIAALSVAPAVAQKRTKLYADQAGGYECRIPWWMGPVPTKPGDQQVLAKFQGKRKVDRGDYKGTRELTVHIIRIRGNTPTTGQETEKDNEGTRNLGRTPRRGSQQRAQHHRSHQRPLRQGCVGEHRATPAPDVERQERRRVQGLRRRQRALHPSLRPRVAQSDVRPCGLRGAWEPSRKRSTRLRGR